MKVQASAPNVFSMRTALPFVSQWEKGAARRAQFTVRPFGSEDLLKTVAEHDDLARKQEIICAVILALCLFGTVLLCCSQLAHL